MKDSFYLAWRYVTWHKTRSVILIVSITLILFLPLALRLLVRSCERQLMARAGATPLIIGAKGSSLDLAIDALYFEPKPLEPIRMADLDRVAGTGLALPIPLDTRFRAQDLTIVGTTLEYFDFRRLTVADGRQMTRLGDCVLGARAARRLGLVPGQHVISSPENLFDLAGTYPLKMRITGILRPSHSPDDLAIFVDIKTAWIIAGLGHGHEDLTRVADPDVLLGRKGGTITANAKLMHYNEITDDNVKSFHLHGDRSTFPVSAIIAVPPDRKSEDLLRGRFQTSEETLQIIRPLDVIRDLTATIFKVEGILNSTFALLTLATLLLIALVMSLSLRLRRPEVQTMFKLGCSRAKIAGMLACELSIMVLVSLILTISMALIAHRYADELLRQLVI